MNTNHNENLRLPALEVPLMPQLPYLGINLYEPLTSLSAPFRIHMYNESINTSMNTVTVDDGGAEPPTKKRKTMVQTEPATFIEEDTHLRQRTIGNIPIEADEFDTYDDDMNVVNLGPPRLIRQAHHDYAEDVPDEVLRTTSEDNETLMNMFAMLMMQNANMYDNETEDEHVV
jgi:hypothetical protein